MDLKEKLIVTPKREDAGGRTSNRFAYQMYWAFHKLLELSKEKADFVLIMEFIEDVIILDSSSNPRCIDFYQVKTNDKKNVQYISASTMTSKSKNSMSFIQKLLDSLNKYPEEARSIHFVSNKFFNFNMKSENIDSREKLNIALGDIGDKDLKKIKSDICGSCIHRNKCEDECHEVIHFDVSELDINNYSETILGKFVNFLGDKYGVGDISNIKAMFHTILSEIMRINNTEKKSDNFSELISSKSITKQRFNELLKEFEKSFLMKDLWVDISQSLRTPQEGYSNIKILRIKKEWDRYKLDVLDPNSHLMSEIKEDIRSLIKKKDFNTYREYIEYILLEISNKDYYTIGLFSKEYFIAIILGELYYE